MTKPRKMTPKQRKAHNKRKKTQRMRKVKRYARALHGVDRYIGGLLDEWLCVYTVQRTEVQRIFRFEMKPKIYSYDLLSMVLSALNDRLQYRRVYLHAGWTVGNGWVIRASTINPSARLSVPHFGSEAHRLMKLLKL